MVFTFTFHLTKVMVVVTQNDAGGIIAPAITVFPWSTENQGLKITIPENFEVVPLDPMEGGLIDMYENSNRQATLEEWIQTISYNYSEILFDTNLGWVRLKSLKNNWVEDVTQSYYGRSYTLELKGQVAKIGPSDAEHQLFIHLLHNATYYIEIHDGNFYLGFMNPNIPIPYILVRTSKEPSFYNFFETTEVENLNRPSKPCDSDPDYNFQVHFHTAASAINSNFKNVVSQERPTKRFFFCVTIVK